jgi:outer membrane protease
MSYSLLDFETADSYKIYDTTITNAFVTSSVIVRLDSYKPNNRFIPDKLVLYYQEMSGSFLQNATINVGYTPPYYSDYFTSASVQLIGFEKGNSQLYDFTNATANANNKIAISGSSQQIHIRWNTIKPASQGPLTASVYLMGYESHGANNVIL